MSQKDENEGYKFCFIKKYVMMMIENSQPMSFFHIFQGKKVYSNRTTRSMGLVGVVEGRHINVSITVFMYILII